MAEKKFTYSVSRKGMGGRKKKADKRLKMAITIAPDVLERIDAEAKKTGKTRSMTMDRLIRDALNRGKNSDEIS